MKGLKIRKINSIHYGGKWLLTGISIGAIIPFLIWNVFDLFLWGFCVVGGIILVGFFVVFTVEMIQDFGKVPYYKKHLKETIPFDRQKQYAVIRSSICTGEKVAGFKNKDDGHFTEVMLIKTFEDEKQFMEIYNIEEIKKEY